MQRYDKSLNYTTILCFFSFFATHHHFFLGNIEKNTTFAADL